MDVPHAPDGATALVERIEGLLAPLESEAARAWWWSNVDTSDDHDRARVAAELALTDALSDRAAYRDVLDALAAGGDGAAGIDPLVVRRLTLLRDAMAPHQIDPALNRRIIELGTEVDSVFSAFRGTIDGRRVDDNEIADILRTSDDIDERRLAWEASKQVGAEVSGRVVELVRLRNEAARSLGYRDHFDLSLAVTELDEPALLALLDEVDEVTSAPFAAWKHELDAALAQRFGCDVDDLRPWHHDNVFFQAAPASAGGDLDELFAGADLVALTRRTYAGLGIDIDPLLERSDLLPRDGKNQHAFSVDLDRGTDIRVLCNVVPTQEWAAVMLHEFGHAAYSAGVDPSLPWGLRTMHSLTTEGIAMMFESLSTDRTWLTTVAEVPADVVDALELQLAGERRADLLTFARWVLVMTNFERGLYADPDADHDTRWWDLVERYQLIRRPDGRSAPDWAAKIHLASAPVYYQNYLLGELMALQLGAELRSRFGGLVDRRAAGRFVVDEVFGPGATLRWDDLIERATGHPLTARHLAEALE